MFPFYFCNILNVLSDVWTLLYIELCQKAQIYWDILLRYFMQPCYGDGSVACGRFCLMESRQIAAIVFSSSLKPFIQPLLCVCVCVCVCVAGRLQLSSASACLSEAEGSSALRSSAALLHSQSLLLLSVSVFLSVLLISSVSPPEARGPPVDQTSCINRAVMSSFASSRNMKGIIHLSSAFNVSPESRNTFLQRESPHLINTAT